MFDSEIVGIGKNVSGSLLPSQFPVQFNHGLNMRKNIRKGFAEFNEGAGKGAGCANLIKELLRCKESEFIARQQSGVIGKKSCGVCKSFAMRSDPVCRDGIVKIH